MHVKRVHFNNSYLVQLRCHPPLAALFALQVVHLLKELYSPPQLVVHLVLLGRLLPQDFPCSPGLALRGFARSVQYISL